MMLSESNTIDSIWKSLEHSKPIRRDPAIHVSVDFTNYIRVDFYSTASQKPAAHLIVLDWDLVIKALILWGART